MFKKLFLSILTVALLASVFQAPTAFGQTSASNRGNVLAFNDARDYNFPRAMTTGSVATGAQTVTVAGDAYVNTPSGRTYLPYSTTHPVLFDANGTAETLVPSAVTCVYNGPQATCTITATFVSAHTGPFSINSGTYGVCEAAGDLPSGGGTVVVNSGFAGTTSTLTTATTGAGACGASTINVLDTRAGSFQFYTYNGSNAYAASTSPFNTATAANADVTTAVGSAYFYGGAFSQATNQTLAAIANAANASGAKISGLKTRATSADGNANTIVVTGDDLFEIDAWGADGAAYVNTAGILFDSIGTIGSTRVPSVIKFYTGTDAAPTVKTLALTLGADQIATFAASLVTTNVTDSGLTSGRVPIASTGGLLVDDGDLTFATDTLTATKLSTTLVTRAAGALALTTTTSGNITLQPAAAATAAVTTNVRLEGAQGASVDSSMCASGDCTLGGDGNFFYVAGTTAVDGFATAGWQAGSIVLVHTDGNITFNNAGTVAAGFGQLLLVGAANVSMTANDLMLLVYDGTAWQQIAPTLVK